MSDNNPFQDEAKASEFVSTTTINPLHAMAYGLAGHAGTALVDAGVSALASLRKEREQRKLARYEMELQREMTRKQMKDERDSFINAGLNPNLLANGGFSPAQVSTPQPAQQNVSGKSPESTALAQQAVLGNTLLEQKANIENVEAQTTGQELKNDEQEILNERLRDEDRSSDDNIRLYMKEAIASLPENSEARKMLENKLNDSNIRFTAGSVKGVNDILGVMRSSSDYGREERFNALHRKVYDLMIKSPAVVNSMAAMPAYEVKKAQAYINEASSVVARNLAEADLAISQSELNQQLVKKVAKELALLQYELESKSLSDSHYLIKHGRGSDLFTHVMIESASLVGDIAKSGAEVYALGKFLKTGRAIAPQSAQAMGNLKARGLQAGILSPKELAGIPIEKRREMARIEFGQFRNLNPQLTKEQSQKAYKRIGAKYGLFENPQNHLRK